VKLLTDGIFGWQISIEPELRTNRAASRMVHSMPPEERVYEPEGTGVMVKKGEEVHCPCLSCYCSVAAIAILYFEERY
jgi:hypothetical protein